MRESNRKRIKYRKVGNVLTSALKFKGNRDSTYSIILNLDEMTYEIKNEHQRRIIKKGGPYKSHVYLKRVAKRALESLGVSFNCEVRNI